jgi:hypothetical protein
MDQQLQRNLLHVFKIPEVFISSIFLTCLVDPSLTTAVTGVSLGVYLKILVDCSMVHPSLITAVTSVLLVYSEPLSSSSTCDRFPLPAIAPLHLRSLPSTCGRSPPPAIASLHLRSLHSTCDRSPPPAVASLHLRSLTLHLRSLPSTCDRFPPSPASAIAYLP